MRPEVHPALKVRGFFPAVLQRNWQQVFFFVKGLGLNLPLFPPHSAWSGLAAITWFGCFLKALLGIPKAKPVLHN